MKKQLDIRIDESSTAPVYEQLANQMRQLICAKTFEPTEQIPSIRALADQLNVSPTTVRRAFQMLIDEGWLTQQRGSGTYVSPSVELQQSYLSQSESATSRSSVGADLSPALLKGTWAEALSAADYIPQHTTFGGNGGVDLSADASPTGDNLPISPVAMTKYISDALSNATTLTDPAGLQELREHIANWVALSRSLQCNAADIIVVSGRQQARSMVARLFGGEGQAIVFENPCNPETRMVFESFGWQSKAVPVDESGIVIEELERIEAAGALYLRPSSQFPTGAVLSKMRRERIANWADKADSIVIEDDIGCDFSFDSRVTAAVSSFVKPERSIYIGSFSHVLPPAWQIAFIVIPLSMREPFYRLKLVSDRCTSPVVQNVLNSMFNDGQLPKTVTRLQRDYARLREVMLEELAKHSGTLTYTPVKGGLHQAVWFDAQVNDTELVRRCREQGVALTPLSPCFASAEAASGVLINFGAAEEAGIRRAIITLRQALNGA
jgi:GntR family transcriptional regulator/MocR family aminotransferase